MYSARIKLPAHFTETQVASLSGAFEGRAVAVTALRAHHKKDTEWELEWIMESPMADADMTARLLLQGAIYDLELDVAANDWQVDKLPEDTDWLSESYKQFPAFEIGPFFIYGGHYEGSVPADKMGLQIDAATAFGSGEHATTEGCLNAMVALEEQGVCPWNVLDMGTGSGILAVAAWKLWKTMILAVDIEEEAVIVAARHRDLNKVPGDAAGMICAAGDGFRTKDVQKKKPFDLIIANILAGPLIEMAHDLKGVSDENGFVILSGMLSEQADSVLSVYEAEDFTLHTREDIDGWATLVLRNAA